MGKEHGRVNMVQNLHIHVNGKMRPVETIPRIGGIKENGKEGEFKYDIFDIL
jgi:hypothetical protein